MVAGVGNADLDAVAGLPRFEGSHDPQAAADPVIFNREHIAPVVLEVARAQVGADDAEGMERIVIEEGIVHPIDDHNPAINKRIHPFGIFIRTKHQIKADRRGLRVVDAEGKRQGGGVIGQGLKHRVHHRVDIGVSIGKAAAAAVVAAIPGAGVAGARSGA